MDPKDIRRKIRDTLRERGPLLRREILAEFADDPVPLDDVDATINKLVSLQVLFPSPRNRVADFDVQARLREEARRLIAERPHSRRDLAVELDKLSTGVSRNFIEKNLFGELREEPDVFLHFGPNNQLLLSTEAPDPETTLEPFHERIEALEKAGIDRNRIQAILFGEAPPSPSSNGSAQPKASSQDDLDFQRDACELLVYAWQDAEVPETRESLEPVMINLGLERVGELGATTEFNGLLHVSERPFQKGDPVRITQPGWQLKNQRGEYLIARARVKAAS